MADFTVSTDIDTFLQSASFTAMRTNLNVDNGADVTDTANVTAAGALMDSELTDLAGIKALDTSTLQVKPAEGAFADGDKTKLDGIATGAEVNTIESATAGEPTGSDVVLNVVSLTQDEYDTGTPVATTFYIING